MTTSFPSVSETVDTQIKGQLLPNPNNGNFTYNLPFEAKQLSVDVIDISGKTVCRQAVKNTSLIELNCIQLSSGVYTVKIYMDDQLFQTEKLIIVK